MKRAVIETLGCKVNQFDSAVMESLLEKVGIYPPLPGEKADICIINTCTVTAKTDRQSRQMIRRLRRENPSAILVVTGCYAETSPEEIAKLGEADLILGNKEKFAIHYILKDFYPGEPFSFKSGIDIDDWPDLDRAPRGHTRALIKVQDGCDNFCSYCIVPHARGRSRSLPMKMVLERIERIAINGYREVVLTGINLGRYGLDLNPPESLKSLIESLEKIKSNIRIRLTSIEPMEIDESLILAIARSRKICHHLHIPLQSGDDEILKRMKRPYTSVDFLERIWMAFREIQDLTVGFDLIAGFPGEEDHHFERTYNFVEGLPFTYLHVFPFSPRKNTEAVSLSGKIPYQRTRERVNALRRLSMERKLKVYRENIGKIHDVLVEGEVEGGIFQGLTSNYLRVYFRGTRDMVNDIVPVKIESVEGERLVGKVNL